MNPEQIYEALNFSDDDAFNSSSADISFDDTDDDPDYQMDTVIIKYLFYFYHLSIIL